MYSGPTIQPPPSSPQLRRYDPQRPGGGRSSAPVEFEGALIDPEQTSAPGDVVSGGRRMPDRPDRQRANFHSEEIPEPGVAPIGAAGDSPFRPGSATGPSGFEPWTPNDLPPPINAAPAPEARLQALAVEARLQIARERARSAVLEAPEADTSTLPEPMSERLQDRIVRMVGLPEDPRHTGVHITA